MRRVFTAEEQKKSQASRAANAAARSRSKLRRNFARDDVLNWQHLARLNKLHLAPWGEPITNGAIEEWLRAVGVSVAEYLEWDGDTRLSQFEERNPDWPLRAWQGVVLEGFAKVRAGEEMSLAEWVDYAKANGINTPELGQW